MKILCRREVSRRPISASYVSQDGMDGEVHELYICCINDYDFFKRNIEPVIKNMQRKIKSGKYDEALALKGWQYAADAAVKWYDRQYGSGKGSLTLMNKSKRIELAEALMDRYDEQVHEVG